MLKQAIKALIKKLPVAFTQNQKYDLQTGKVIKKVCKHNSNCIDVGAHKGEVLDEMLKYAPGGTHFAFEPIPVLNEKLKEKYSGNSHCVVSAIALSNKKGEASFNYVTSNPSYSGLIKRKYDRENETDELITVQTDRMDEVVPKDKKIDLIKIDVEGGEYLVLDGGRETLTRNKPVVIFEHGLGASDMYGTTPAQVYDLIAGCGLKISTMANWLASKNAFTKQEFENCYHNRIDYYFIAYP